MLQISKEDFYQFKEEIRTEFARIYGRMDKIETQIQALNAEMKAQIQALNQRIDAVEKRLDDTNNKINLFATLFGGIFVGILGFLATFLYSWIGFIREHKEKKADKEEVIKLQEKIKELEAQNYLLMKENKELKEKQNLLLEAIWDLAQKQGNKELMEKLEPVKRS